MVRKTDAVHAYLHGFFVWIMGIMQSGGYAGVVLLMAMESSIFPVPSELVIPPAAYWASQGKMSFAGVVLAGTLGSWIGSAITYWISAVVGRPLVMRFGKYFLMPPDKLEMAERWVAEYGSGGIFFARLLPVIRHLISIPAGVCRMNFLKFSVMTITGAFIWCSILAWFGPQIITEPMFSDPDTMVKELKARTKYIIALIALIAALYAVMKFLSRRKK